MAVVFDIRHDARVRSLVECNDLGSAIGVGRLGKVLAMRTSGSGRACYLVKWDGKSGPVAVMRTGIEEATQ